MYSIVRFMYDYLNFIRLGINIPKKIYTKYKG